MTDFKELEYSFSKAHELPDQRCHACYFYGRLSASQIYRRERNSKERDFTVTDFCILSKANCQRQNKKLFCPFSFCTCIYSCRFTSIKSAWKEKEEENEAHDVIVPVSEGKTKRREKKEWKDSSSHFFFYAHKTMDAAGGGGGDENQAQLLSKTSTHGSTTSLVVENPLIDAQPNGDDGACPPMPEIPVWDTSILSEVNHNRVHMYWFRD
jgi:hypothetical protein